ncbi:MAG: sulfatase-like hydrolase/transferase [Myxococcota bacterium]
MILALLAAGCGSAPVAPTPHTRPDVIVVSVDTLRADHLGFLGHEAAHTPAIDALARSGFAFRRATTPEPRTTPALASLQTGLRPTHHGAREVGDVVTAEGRLAGWLAAAGWQTAAVSAMAVVSPEQAMDRGFDQFEVHHDERAASMAERALALARGLEGAEPAYLWVHFADPHFPYLPDPHGPVQPDAPTCRRVAEQAAAGKLRRVELFADRGGRATAMLDECRALYDAEIAAVDEAVGALLAGLAEARPGPRLVVFTADHGENQGEDGLFFEHGPSVDDADVHIPLVFAGDGVPAGTDDGVARLRT